MTTTPYTPLTSGMFGFPASLTCLDASAQSECLCDDRIHAVNEGGGEGSVKGSRLEDGVDGGSSNVGLCDVHTLRDISTK